MTGKIARTMFAAIGLSERPKDLFLAGLQLQYHGAAEGPPSRRGRNDLHDFRLRAAEIRV